MARLLASELVFVGILIAVVGIFFIGGFALLVAIIFIGIAVTVVEGELANRFAPRSTEPPHPLRYACPSCGGDAYVGQGFCPECGAALPAAGKPEA